MCSQLYSLFFALPGFLTVLLIRYTALYKRALTQAEFVFYSLACSIPSYLTAALLAEVVGVVPCCITPVLTPTAQWHVGVKMALMQHGKALGTSLPTSPAPPPPSFSSKPPPPRHMEW